VRVGALLAAGFGSEWMVMVVVMGAVGDLFSNARQHKMLNVNVLRPLKHYFLEDIMNFGRRLKRHNYEG
jgi:hypothetical protein